FGTGPDNFERFSRDSIIKVNTTDRGFSFDIHRKSYQNDTLVYNDYQSDIYSIDLKEIESLCQTQYPSLKLPYQNEYLGITNSFQYHLKDSFYQFYFNVNGVKYDASKCKTNIVSGILSQDFFDSRFTLRQTYKTIWEPKIIIGALINGKSYLNPWIPTSTNEVQSADLKIYPNPAQNTLFLNHSFNNNTQVEVYTTDGKLLIQDNLGSNENSIDVSQLSSGTYLLKMVNDEGVWQKRILVNK
ncbi:MAG: T9SS type A sorting domain-containing protein, partial [Bacteroidia bacterium]